MRPRTQATAVHAGPTISTAGFLLITIGTRYVPAAEVPLLAPTEFVLARVWVSISVGETPGALTLGGGIVIAPVVGQAIVGLRARRAGGGATTRPPRGLR